MGTSPLTRGQRVFWVLVNPRVGNIPAYAGTTGSRITKYPIIQEHPRLRGDNATTLNLRSAYLGTSPLTRGQHGRVIASTNRYGNIPAYAGTTLSGRA